MKNITNNTETTRNMNGGGVLEVAAAMGVIYGAYEAGKWAWDTGAWLGKKIYNAISR